MADDKVDMGIPPGMSDTAMQHLAVTVETFYKLLSRGPVRAQIVSADQHLEGLPILVELLGDPETQALQVSLAALALRHRDHPAEVLYAADGYVSRVPTDEFGPDTPRPKDDPSASEAIHFVYAGPTGVWRAYLAYGRGDGGSIEAREFSGWWSDDESPDARAVALAVAVVGADLDDAFEQVGVKPDQLAELGVVVL